MLYRSKNGKTKNKYLQTVLGYMYFVNVLYHTQLDLFQFLESSKKQLPTIQHLALSWPGWVITFINIVHFVKFDHW